MQTKIDAHQITLRRDAIRKALVRAAIAEEGSSQLRARNLADLQSWWFVAEERLPTEVIVYLVDREAPAPMGGGKK